MTWNGLSLSDAAFEKRLAEAAKFSPKPEVYILPNKHVTYNQVAHLLKILQRYDVKMGLIGNEQAP